MERRTFVLCTFIWSWKAQWVCHWIQTPEEPSPTPVLSESVGASGLIIWPLMNPFCLPTFSLAIYVYSCLPLKLLDINISFSASKFSLRCAKRRPKKKCCDCSLFTSSKIQKVKRAGVLSALPGSRIRGEGLLFYLLLVKRFPIFLDTGSEQ